MGDSAAKYMDDAFISVLHDTNLSNFPLICPKLTLTYWC